MTSYQEFPLSIAAYLLEEQFLPNFISIGFEKMEPWAFFEDGRPNKKNKKNNNNKMSSDMRSVPDPKVRQFSSF